MLAIKYQIIAIVSLEKQNKYKIFFCNQLLTRVDEISREFVDELTF
jgi:hypothetical protein